MDEQASRNRILAVDLDGTLLRSDALYECFWSAFGRDWRVPFHAIRAMSEGKAALKRRLAAEGPIDAASLPYDPEVLAFVRDWKAQGGRTALVTASDQSIAESIAGHLGVFDEVHGSDGRTNLKGETKARFLSDRFGPRNFAYMGDSAADLPVWRQADKAITVNAPASLRRETDALGTAVEHLGTSDHPAKAYLKALRPHQWLKNILVFLPMLAGHRLDWPTFWASLAGFVAFCLIASAVYVLNDLLDLAADRAHPRKRLRPFASGRIPIRHGTWMAAGLLALGALVSMALGGRFLLVMATYFVTTSAYSLGLKRRIVIDIFVLAGLYSLRIIGGGAAAGIPLSVWLLAFALFFFFSLAAVKRQAELVDLAKRGKLDISGRGYRVDDLPIISMMAIGSGYVSVMVMALYVNSDAVVDLYSSPTILWGICCVLLYWISRTVMVAHRGKMNDDPVVYAATDRISQACFALVFVFVIAGAVL